MPTNAHVSSRRHQRLYGVQKSAISILPRPKLSQDDLKVLAAKMRSAYCWDADPKDFQLRGVQAQIEGTDIIVQAPTGAGKTALAAGPHLWPGNETKFTIMVCPLLSLEEEMCQTFVTEFGLQAIALNSKNGACSPRMIKDILAHKYKIIIVSPEMLQSRTFTNRILRNSRFMKDIISLFIDEAHCIVLWGADFRKKYGTLGKVRAFLPRGTPVIAVSATLSPRVVRAIWASLHFSQSDTQSRYENEGNDRANVAIVVRACEHPLNTYADLSFVIPPTLESINDIPKTYIYVDNIATGGEIIDYLNRQLEKHRDLATAPAPLHDSFCGIIRPFNATLSHRYRTLAMSYFREGRIHVLVCTDAAGMGCDIPDIDRVIQWKLPATFSQFIQRAGRAARGRDRTGIAILLVERSAYSIDLLASTDKATSLSRPKLKGKAVNRTDRQAEQLKEKRDRADIREYALAHGVARGGSAREDALPDGPQPPIHEDSADEGLLTFVQSTSCRRKIWAAVFDNSHPLSPVVPCCDICVPSLLDRARPPSLPPERRARNPKRGQPDCEARDKLRAWRKYIFRKHHASAQYDQTSILDEELILLLVSHGPLSVKQALDLIKDKWPFYDMYAEELGAFLADVKVKFIPLPTKSRGQEAALVTPIPEQVHLAAPSLTRRYKRAPTPTYLSRANETPKRPRIDPLPSAIPVPNRGPRPPILSPTFPAINTWSSLNSVPRAHIPASTPRNSALSASTGNFLRPESHTVATTITTLSPAPPPARIPALSYS
ncbi:P-loop containing nucleoside triphosphate hydrolase protein [Dichomitus squalens LYAD-421 SS1]|uniref:DNA 3'-5' helicase n=1 Tax=Dichomitus squalens (strain LYAD-421) TaxID=732165 RepID=R7SLZ2_DICSQ|nr:P-loop containing nucleoside triphosphate hydrolase protein [Dichomitus squalens LYAD-421 SS1]EJF56898.1 P-loop containing nucleoside triphosphate hydrolase protein [Dichomitus squalens LYAD-421 SS1]